VRGSSALPFHAIDNGQPPVNSYPWNLVDTADEGCRVCFEVVALRPALVARDEGEQREEGDAGHCASSWIRAASQRRRAHSTTQHARLSAPCMRGMAYEMLGQVTGRIT
jgi:hypothetical protein